VKQLAAIALEGDAERVRRNHAEAIAELQASPLWRVRIVEVTLADGVETTVAHGLGRAPRMLWISPPRGATSTGRIDEIRGGTRRADVVVLKATGWGATITVDVAVIP
jgi:hypothetical protein